MKRNVLQLCGLGAHPPGETTLEVLQALESSDRVVFEPDDPELKRWLKRWCPKLIDSSSLGETTGEQADAVLKDLRGVVSVAVWGHPLLSSELGLELARRARGSRVELRIPGAVSPIGSAFAKASAFFGGDYGYRGIQACSLEEALGDGLELDGGLPIVVFGSATRPDDWDKVGRRLEKIFAKGLKARVFPCGEPETAAELSRLGKAVAGARRAVVLAAPELPPAVEGRGKR
jgi:hypothetical protein